MRITVNIIEDEKVVWITDDHDQIGVESSCVDKSELKRAFDKYVEHFVDDFCCEVKNK